MTQNSCLFCDICLTEILFVDIASLLVKFVKANLQLHLVWRVFGLDLEGQHPGRSEVSHSMGRVGEASSFYIRKL